MLLAGLLLGSILPAWAQPTWIGTQVVNGTYNTYSLNTVGGFKQLRLQATSGGGTGTRNWEFASGGGSIDYTNNWRPYTAGLTLANYNVAIAPVAGTASALYNSASGGQSGLLPAVVANSYYTFNITNLGPSNNNTMAVLQTTYNPVTISSVSSSAAAAGLPITVTAVTSGAPNAAEYVYLRYTFDNFATSGVVPMQVSTSTSTFSAMLPTGGVTGAGTTVGTTAKYYVFTSPNSPASGTVTGTTADMLTLNLNNNGGSNYSSTLPVTTIFFEPFDLATWSNATGTAANLVSTGFGAWSSVGTGNNQWQRNDYTTGWTSASGGTAFTAANGLIGTAARFHSFNAANLTTGDLITPTLNFSSYSGNKTLLFNIQNTSGVDKVDVYLSTNNGTSYGSSLGTFTTYATFTQVAVPLGTTTSSTVKIKLTATSDFGNDDIGIDNFLITNPVPLNSSPYTINNTLPTGGSNFNSFGDAFTALNANGVGGALIFNVSAGQTFSEAPRTLTATGTVSNTITFQKSGGGANPILQGTTGTGSTDAIVQLIGSDYVTFDGIDLKDNAANGTATTKMERGLWLNTTSGTDGCQNNTYKNGVITLDKTNGNTTVGVYTFSSASAAGGANSSNSFLNNTVQNASQGYQFNGSSTALDQSNVINTSGGTSLITNLGGTAANPTGVQLNAQNLMTIANTTISSITAAAGFTAYGISNLVTASTNLTISNNTITGLTSASTGTPGVGGIVFSVASTGTISGNTLTSFSTTAAGSILYGISSSTNTSKFDVTQNQLNNFTQTNAGSGGVLYGIDVATPSGQTVNISRNYLHTFTKSNTSGIVYGIRIAIGSVAAGTIANITNNLIANLTANAASGGTPDVRAINIATGNVVNVYYNTVYLSGTATNASHTSAAFYATTGPANGGIDFRNNIFSNKITGGLRNAGIYRTSATVTTLATTSNNNLVYGTTALYYDGTNTSTTLTQYQLAVNGGAAGARETAAVTESTTPFVSASDPHLNTATATQAESGAQVIAGITVDYDGQTRNVSTPDIGGDEGAFTAADFTAPTITYTVLSNTGSTASRTLVVTITDASGIATGGNAPRIYYRKNAGAYVNANASSIAGNAYTFTISYAAVGGIAIGDVISYYVAAQDLASTPNVATSPTGGSGATPPGTTAPGTPNSYTILTALTGTYYVTATVGSSPNPAKEFATLTAAAAAYNANGLGSAVTFELFDNAYVSETFPIVFGANGDASATNTLTVKPSTGKTVTMTGSNAKALIVLDGADYVTLDGSNAGSTSRDWTLLNTNNGTTSAVIWGQTNGASNGATNNTLKNLIVSGSVSTGSTLFGIGFGSATIGTSSLGTGNNNNTVQNNSVRKAQYGIYSQGASAAAKNTGTVITQNDLTAASPNALGFGGIVVGFEDGISITLNSVDNIVSTTTNDAVGISVGYTANATSNTSFGTQEVTNATISRNTIGVVKNTNTYSATGIALGQATSGTSTIANNFIAGVSSNGTSGDFGAGIFVGGGTGSTTRVVYNSVSMTGVNGGASAGTQPGFALAIGGSNPTVLVRNNALLNTQSGSTSSTYHAIGLNYSTYTNLTSDHNDLFVTAGGTPYFVGMTGALVGGTTRATLTDWFTATAQDQPVSGGGTSLSVDPQFVSTTDLHVQSTSPLNATGTPISGITTDYDGDTRNVTTPDIGGDEFTPLTTDVKATALVAPAASPACYTSSEAITVRVQNSAAVALTGTINVTVVATPPTGPTQMFTGSQAVTGLAAGATADVTVSGTLDMTALGAYSFDLTATTTGDQNAANDNLAVDPTRTVAAPPVGTLTSSVSTVCGTAANSVLLSLPGTTYGTVQFQQSINGGGLYTNVGAPQAAGGTVTTTVTNVSQTTLFRAQVSCTPTALSTSNAVTVTDTRPGQTVVAVAEACEGDPFTIAVTGTGVNSGAATISGSKTESPALAIPDASTVGASSTITLSGAGTATLSNASTIRVTFTIPHAFDADLDLYLVNPDGTKAIELTTDNGSTGVNYTNTVLLTGFGTPVTSGTAPFTGTYAPEGTITTAPNLAGAFTGTYAGIIPAAALNGSPINGTWTLRAFDDASSDVGTISNWSLAITDPNIPRYTHTVSGPGTVSAVVYSGTGSVTGTATVTAAPAGAQLYTITTTDVAGCTSTTTQSVTVNPKPVAGLDSQVNVLCFGGTTGTATVTATVGTAPFTFKRNGSTIITQASPTYTFTGLTAGSYTLSVTDAKTCTSANVPVTITQPATALVGTLSNQVNPTCFGGSGTFDITASGGTAPYEFFDGGVWVAEPSGVHTYTRVAGTYGAQVRDANLCTTSVPVTISQPTAVTASFSITTPILCNGGTATVTMSASGGSGSGFEFSVDGSGYTATTVYVLNAGSHSVRAKDSNGCLSNLTNFSVSQPTVITFSRSKTDATCPGGTDGTITFSAETGGSGTGYQYFFGLAGSGANTPTTNPITGLSAGTYDLRVQDSNGCSSAVVQLAVGQPAPIVPNVVNATSTTFCPGGSVLLTATGGYSSYQWLLDGSPLGGETNQSILATLGGTYTVQVTNGIGCSGTSAGVVVTVLPAPTASAAQDKDVCVGGTASVTFTLTGIAPFNFQYRIGGASPVSVTGHMGSTYTVSVPNVTAATFVRLVSSLSDTQCSSTSGLPGVTVTPVTTTTWTGTASTDWYDENNWTACVPSSTVDAVIPTGKTVEIGSGTAAVRDLDVQGTATLSLTSGANLSVYGNFTVAATATFDPLFGGIVSFLGSGSQQIPSATYLTLVVNGSTPKMLGGAITVNTSLDLTNGLIQLGAFDLNLAASASLVGFGPNHFVITDGAGRLAISGVGAGGQGTVTFPIGASSSSYTPATLTNTGTLDTFFGHVSDAVPFYAGSGQPVGSHVVKKTWDIDELVDGGSVATLKLQWNTADEGTPFNRARVAIAHFNNGIWDLLNTTFGPAASEGTNMWSRTRSSLTSFSPFAVQDESSPLPVELTWFKAVRAGANAQLTWETASERQSRGFEVQVRSGSSSEWRALGFVASRTANSAVTQQYGFVDRESGKAGVRYYRLAQQDLDGTVNYSPVQVVTFGTVIDISVQAFPNPFSSSLMAVVQAPVSGVGTLTLTDGLGRQVLRQEAELGAGATEVAVALPSELASGSYVLSVQLADGQVTRTRIVKQ